MRLSLKALVAAITLCLAPLFAQSVVRNAQVGYLYPAGGGRGTTFHVLAGGQSLRGVSRVHITGEGISASVVRYIGRIRKLNRAERTELRKRLQELKGEEPSTAFRDGTPPRFPAGKSAKKTKEKAEEATLPKHPLLSNLEDLTPWELKFVETEFFRIDRKAQQNNQIAEKVLIEVTIDADADPGDRELRLQTPLGLSNPLCFQVGMVPEICEEEPVSARAPNARAPNARETNARTPAMEPVEPPVLLNGQIRPGDIDRFRIRAKKGQQLVIAACARHLIPYLADAVPGWFQATLTLFDAAGKEVAFADDFRFSPDPVLAFKIPETGIYELEVRDSIYRGREDFVYRISLGEHPFVKSFFPLGGRSGKKTVATLAGWNLSTKKTPLDTTPGGATFRQTALRKKGSVSNLLTYNVDTLPECLEKEPDDTERTAQKIKLPQIVNGCIARDGDEDRFRFEGKAGDEIVIEVYARRLHSPLDSLLRLIDSGGRILAWNDDFQHKAGFLHRDMGIITHHADSYIHTRLPGNGTYFVQITDSQRHGGEAYGYRLRVSHPRPDFAVHITPSSVTTRAGFGVPITVHVLRRDGFEGAVTMKLKDAPSGFSLQGGVVPAGRDSIRMTLTAPRKQEDEPVSLCLMGIAGIGGKKIRREAVPSEEVMQAFLYRHLLPSQELVAASGGGRFRFPPPVISSDIPIRIPAGGSATVAFNIPKRGKLDRIDLELNNPPKGLSLHDVSASSGVLTFRLAADGEAVQAGFKDNLIVEAFTELPNRRQSRQGGEGKNKGKKQRISLGVLPAIPIEVLKR
jgi:hypothetical protein